MTYQIWFYLSEGYIIQEIYASDIKAANQYAEAIAKLLGIREENFSVEKA